MISIDILIPTYNRIKFLMDNIISLETIVANITNAEINIIVSDNASTDGTSLTIRNYIDKESRKNLHIFTQDENIGLTKNVISCVKRSSADFVLLLGDDDYLNTHYLQTAINFLNSDKEITCILPSFEAISEDGTPLGYGRDMGLKTKCYQPGIKNVVINSHRAHQISGIIVKRNGLVEELMKNQIDNLYPQIYMVAYACLHGKSIHIPEYPILVTQTANKAWKYDDVGLLNDIFQNFYALSLDDKSQFLAEKEIIDKQYWRVLRHWKNPLKQIHVILKISLSPYTSKRGKLFFPFLISYYCFRYGLSASKRKIMHLCR